MEVGNVNSKHFVLSLKVKSVLDPCEDENMSVGGDSMERDEDSQADSQVIKVSNILFYFINLIYTFINPHTNILFIFRLAFLMTNTSWHQ